MAAELFMYVIGTRRSTSMTLVERLPRLLDLVDVGHVGHRAAGVEVGEDHLLVVVGEDVGGLGHEVHAAEHDEVGLWALLGEHRQAVAVAPGVGPADDLVALVVVAEDEQAVAEGGLGGGDALVRARLRVAVGVPLGERSLDAQHVRMSPYGFRGSGGGRWGQPGRLTHGDVVLGTDMYAGYPAGVGGSVSARAG